MRTRGASPGARWAVVLAGGSGTRLHALTTAADGTVVPKQYCSIDGERSLLRAAIERATRHAPLARVLVVVAAQHDRFWRPEFAGPRSPHAIVQPENRGTAAGVLLPLLAIARRDPRAVVVLLPADHFVADEEPLRAALEGAAAAAIATGSIVLLGVEPDDADTGYGWILPGQADGPVVPVAAFVEKPGAREAEALLAGGALWNAFLLAAPVRSLIDLYAERMPDLLDAFVRARPHASPTRARALYRELPVRDFSRDLLQGAERRLRLLRAPRCGWTDLGTPARVAQCAARLAPSARLTAPRAVLDLRSVAGDRQLA